MARLLYTATLPFDTLCFTADLDQASAPILLVQDEDGTLAATGYQTADARHRLRDALRLALESCGRIYWMDPSDSTPANDQLDALVEGAGISWEAVA